MKRYAHNRQGFTLLEILVVVAILGILAAIAVPQYNRYKRRAQIATVAANLRNFATAFVAYSADHGEYPDDCHFPPPFNLPPGSGMERLIAVEAWLAETEVGGNYNWEGPNGYPYAGISIFGATAPVEEMEILDAILDNGQLASGRFRQTPNGRYTYIVEE